MSPALFRIHYVVVTRDTWPSPVNKTNNTSFIRPHTLCLNFGPTATLWGHLPNLSLSTKARACQSKTSTVNIKPNTGL